MGYLAALEEPISCCRFSLFAANQHVWLVAPPPGCVTPFLAAQVLVGAA
jgi:hypothetical protein